MSSPSRSVGMRRRDVEGAFEPDGAGKPPELPLHKMKGLIRPGPRRGLFAGDEQDAGAVEHADGGSRHPGDVDRHLDGGIGFKHVERG